MIENDEDYASTIAFLKRELKERENEVRKAATIGKQLLEKKNEFEHQIEALEQDKYSLHLKLEIEKQVVRTQASEIETYVKQINCLQRDIPTLEKEVSVLRQRNDNLLKEKQDYEKTVEELQVVNSALKNKVVLLEQQIETYKNMSVLNDTRCEEDQPDINEYISKINTLEGTLCELQDLLRSTKLSEKRLMQSVVELEEAVSDRDKELSSEVQRVTELQETISELQCEIETLKLGQLDVNRRGNSMFAELDDRRTSVEKQYKELSKRYSNMLTNYEENKKQLINCKGQLAILSSMTSKKHQEDQIKRLRQMLSEALRKKEELTAQLCRAQKEMQNLVQAPIVKGDQYNYLRILNQQAQEKIARIENEFISEKMQAQEFEEKLARSIQELYACQEAYQELRCENLKLKQELKEISSKPDVCVPKPKVNIEIIPGFESNPEKTLKENAEPKEKNNDNIPGELSIGDNKFVKVKAPTLSNTRLHTFHVPPKTETLPVGSILKETNQQNVVAAAEEHSKPTNFPEDRKINCAQQ